MRGIKYVYEKIRKDIWVMQYEIQYLDMRYEIRYLRNVLPESKGLEERIVAQWRGEPPVLARQREVYSRAPLHTGLPGHPASLG